MKKIILFTLIAVLTSACLEYKEKMTLNNDGSGEIKFAIGLNESLFSMNKDSVDVKDFDEAKLREKYSNAIGIEFIGSRSYVESGNRWIEIHLRFDSFDALVAASKDSSNLGMIGELKMHEGNKGTMIFERQISDGKNGSETDSANSEKGEDVFKAMFLNYKWNYELTLPGKIITTNASPNDVDEKTNTVKWYFTLGSLGAASKMYVEYEKTSEINLGMLLLLVVGAIVLALVLLYLIKLKKD